MRKREPDKTRQSLLQAAFDEINHHGFQSASLNRILNETHVTKGALYHHFPSKLELGYAVIDELIRPDVTETWIEPLRGTDNIVDALLTMIDNKLQLYTEKEIHLGCPLNNLSQEMSPIDEGFRERINAVFDDWRNTIAAGLREGQKKGIVKKDISADASAYFIVAAIEGASSLAKNARQIEVLNISLNGLKEHIETLRHQEPDTIKQGKVMHG